VSTVSGRYLVSVVCLQSVIGTWSAYCVYSEWSVSGHCSVSTVSSPYLVSVVCLQGVVSVVSTVSGPYLVSVVCLQGVVRTWSV